MGKVSKIICLLLVVVLAAVSLLAIEPTYAQSTPKPSVPEFTIRYVEQPFDVAPSYSIDPYSGDNITIQQAHRVQNRSIEIVVKNQPFTPFKDSNGSLIELFYNVSSKGYYGDHWYYYPTWERVLPVIASDNEYTVLSFGFDVNYEKGDQFQTFSSSPYGFWFGGKSSGDKVDFRVQALIGYYNDPSYRIALEYNHFNGKVSDWSKTQTITIPASDTSPAPSPTVPEFNALMLIPLFAVGLLAVIALKFKGRKVGAR